MQIDKTFDPNGPSEIGNILGVQPEKDLILEPLPPGLHAPSKTRIPFGGPQQQLAVEGIPGYHLHWINDWHPQMTDRLQQALNAGYTFVGSSEVEQSPLIGASTTDLGGSRISRTVGTRPDGNPITAYLMKIPTEYWLEHQRMVWDRADKVDKAIRRGAGGAKVEGGYDPRGEHTSLSSGLREITSDELNGKP